MINIKDISEPEFNMSNLFGLRYDEQLGIVKVYYIQGTLIFEENGKRNLEG